MKDMDDLEIEKYSELMERVAEIQMDMYCGAITREEAEEAIAAAERDAGIKI